MARHGGSLRFFATLGMLLGILEGPAVFAQQPDPLPPSAASASLQIGQNPETTSYQVAPSTAFLEPVDIDKVLTEQPTPAPAPNAPSVWSFDKYNPYVQRYGLGYTAGDGVGFNGGFGTLEWMTPINGDGEWDLLFGDVRFNILNDASIASNVGLGYRWYDLGLNRIFGVNAFWDWRDTGRNGFNQLGIGIESLGPLVDFRANAYIPDIGETTGVLPGNFVGHNLILNREIAMTGADAELGLSVLNTDRVQLKVFGGGYYYDGHKAENAAGWRVRAEADLDQQYNVNFRLQQDDVFGTTANVAMTIRFLHRFLPPYKQTPVPMDHKFFRRYGDAEAGTISSRLSDPVERQQNIAVTRISDIARDPTTGLALNFLHVVNGGAGTGTIENPYGTLTAALADAAAGNSIIYTPQGGTFNENIVLVPGAQVLGNGPAQVVNTQFGLEQLPFSPGAAFPTLTGDVTMASNSRFSGFNVTGHLIANGVSDITVDNANFDAAAGNAISLTGVNGATLTNVSVTAAAGRGALITDSDATLTNFTVETSSDDGIQIDNGATGRTVTINNLQVQSAGGQGLDVNVAGAGDLTLNLTGTSTTSPSNIASAGNAIDVNLSGAGDAIVSLSNTSVRSTTGRGINLDGSAGTGTLFLKQLSGVTVTRASTGGFIADTVTFDADPTTAAIDAVTGATLTVGSSTTLTNIVGDGVRLTDTSGNVSFTTLDIFNSAGTGLSVDTTGAGTTFTMGTGGNSTISTTGGAAMNLNTLTASMAFDSVRSVNSPTNGIFFNAVRGSVTSAATTVTMNVANDAIVIQNTPPTLVANFGTTNITSVISTLFGDNIDITNGNGGNLTLNFTSLNITGP